MDFENMQPDVARRMLPHIDEAIDTYDTDEDLTEDNLSRMVSHVVSRSGLAVDPPAHHNPRTVNDVARVLLLARLAEEAGLPFWAFYSPFFVPVAPFGGPSFGPPRRPSRPRRPGGGRR